MIKKAFTLIELLIATLIFSVVAVSAYSVFNSGVLTWRRLNDASDFYQEARVTLELMANEIASFVPSKSVTFKGSSDKIAFLSRTNLDDKNKLARVEFFLDQSTDVLMCTREGLDSVLNESQQTNSNTEHIITEEVAPNVKRLTFKYYCPKQGEKDKYVWVDSFDPEGQSGCLAVSILVEFIAKTYVGSANEGRQTEFTRIVPIYTEIRNEQASS